MKREFPALILLLIGTALLAALPAFRTAENLQVVGFNAAFLGILACGQTLILTSGGLDLSVGAAAALCSCLASVLLTQTQLGLWAIPAALIAGLFCGGLNGFLITVRRLPPILTTLATLLLFRYGTSIVTGGRSYSSFPASFTRLGSGWIPVLIFLAAAAGFTVLAEKTAFGRGILASGGSESAARLSGVSVDRNRALAYGLCGLCAGASGLLISAFNNNASAGLGGGIELEVIAACVVGGVSIKGGEGTVWGAALGAVLIALLRDGLILTQRPVEQYGLFTGGVILFSAAASELFRGRSR